MASCTHPMSQALNPLQSQSLSFHEPSSPKELLAMAEFIQASRKKDFVSQKRTTYVKCMNDNWPPQKFRGRSVLCTSSCPQTGDESNLCLYAPGKASRCTDFFKDFVQEVLAFP